MVAVVTDLNDSRKVPAVGVPVIARVWTSLVGEPVSLMMSPMLAGDACVSGAASKRAGPRTKPSWSMPALVRW
jgi:hypothetical protein